MIRPSSRPRRDFKEKRSMTSPPRLALATILFIATAVALLATLPAAQAAQVRLIYPGGSQTVPLTDLTTRSIQFVPRAGNAYDVQVRVSSSLPIQQLQLHACKAATPASCSLSAQSLAPDTAATFSWNSLADQTASYPQQANLLILAQISTSKGLVWQAYWHRLQRTSTSQFLNLESSLDADLTVASLEAVQAVKRFLQDFNSLPFNPAQTKSVTFPAAASADILSSNAPPASLAKATSALPLSALPAATAFLFPDGANHPYTAVQNPTYAVGNGVCESALGETSANSCSDCGCPANSYCDASQSCKPESAISLAVTSVSTPTSCSSLVSVTAALSNLPTAATLSSASASLANAPAIPTCTLSGSTLACSLPLPADCAQGKSYSPNSLAATITYLSGAAERTKPLTAPLPTITVQSAVCGNSVCESSLGETSSTCCSDCACPAGQLCAPALPPSGGQQNRCSTDSISATAASQPATFPTYPASGLPLSATLTVTSTRPATLSTACAAACTESTAGTTSQCQSSSCSFSCSQTSSSGPTTTYACTGTAQIASYKQTSSYSLTPALTALVTTEAGQPARTFTLPLQPLTIGAAVCGDRVASSPTETPTTCCFDTGCPQGQYCSSGAVPSPADQCKPLPALALAAPASAQFEDTDDPHELSFPATLANSPPTFTTESATCTLPDTPGCRATCAQVPPFGGDANLRCSVTIPSIPDYASHPRFSPTEKTIQLPAGELTLTYRSPEAGSTVRRTATAPLPPMTLIPAPFCGNNACDTALGESASNCCTDCACASDSRYGDGFFCSTAAASNGRCLAAGSVAAQFIEPRATRCEIQLEGGCAFTRQPSLDLVVDNPPDDLRITAASYSLANLKCAPGQDECALPCGPILQPSPPDGSGSSSTPVPGRYRCYPTLPPLKQTAEGTQSLPLTASLTASFRTGDTLVTKNLTAATQFSITRENSEIVTSCDEQQADLDSKLDKLESARRIVIVILAVLVAIWLAAFVCCKVIACSFISGGTACYIWGLGITVIPCVASIAFPALAYIEGHIAAIKNQKAALCATGDRDDVERENAQTKQLVYSAVGIVASYLCAKGLTSSGGDSAASGTASTEGIGTFEESYTVAQGTGGTETVTGAGTAPSSGGGSDLLAGLQAGTGLVSLGLQAGQDDQQQQPQPAPQPTQPPQQQQSTQQPAPQQSQNPDATEGT